MQYRTKKNNDFSFKFRKKFQISIIRDKNSIELKVHVDQYSQQKNKRHSCYKCLSTDHGNFLINTFTCIHINYLLKLELQPVHIFFISQACYLLGYLNTSKKGNYWDMTFHLTPLATHKLYPSTCNHLLQCVN